MYVLKTNIATRIAVGPLVDPTDGKTAETALAVAGIACQLYRMDAGNAVTRTAITLTASGTSNDMIPVPLSTDGMYDLELTAAQLNFLGNARLCFYDVDGHLVHWIDLQVVSANWWDFMFGSTPITVNLTSAATAAAADALLDRRIDGGAVGTGEGSSRQVKQALYALRNKWVAGDGTLTVYGPNDSTVSWVATYSSNAAAEPMTSIDPAGP
jgi:hypothetical protein